jgi:hypothetical protein
MEQRIWPIIESCGYGVNPSYHYEDPDTGKSREVDVHALKVCFLHPDAFDLFTPTLVVACRNNRLPVIAFTHENRLRGIDVVRPVAKAGWPFEAEDSGSLQPIEPFLKFGDCHHYYTAERIASQYCRLTESKQARKGEPPKYVADHGDLHEDLDSLLKAVDAQAAEYRRAVSRPAALVNQETGEANINLALIYPVMLFAGELYECRQSAGRVRLGAANHVVLLRRVRSRAIRGEFFVDLVRESYLGYYLAVIGGECEEIESRLRNRQQPLRRGAGRQLRGLSEQLL